MLRLVSLLLVWFALASAGCNLSPNGDRSDGLWLSNLARKKAPFSTQRNEQPSSRSNEKYELTPSNWIAAIPSDGVRAETIPVLVPGEVALALLPSLEQSKIRLASTHSVETNNYRLVEVDGVAISDFGQCQNLAKALSEEVKIELKADSTPESANIHFRVTPQTLNTMVQTVASEQKVLRVNSGGDTKLVVREGPIRSEWSARIDRNHGLMLVDVALQSFGNAKLIPVEVQATDNSTALRCLTAAEVLEVLYGSENGNSLPVREAGTQASFAEVSEREDYLVPSNYKRLESAFQENLSRAEQQAAQPFLLDLPHCRYPGSAVLGDARALSGLLLQRQLGSSDKPAATGWIVFGDSSLRNATSVELRVDLGFGPRTLHFSLPAD